MSTVEDGIELLTGTPAGSGAEGYGDGTVFGRVEATLKRFDEIMARTSGRR